MRHASDGILSIYALFSMNCVNALSSISCSMNYPIQTPNQLSIHLRSLRRARGLSQAELGVALGVGQTRVARIEGNPTAISVEQLIEVLGALGVQLVLRDMGAQRPATHESITAAAKAKQRRTGGDW